MGINILLSDAWIDYVPKLIVEFNMRFVRKPILHKAPDTWIGYMSHFAFLLCLPTNASICIFPDIQFGGFIEHHIASYCLTSS